MHAAHDKASGFGSDASQNPRMQESNSASPHADKAPSEKALDLVWHSRLELQFLRPNSMASIVNSDTSIWLSQRRKSHWTGAQSRLVVNSTTPKECGIQGIWYVRSRVTASLAPPASQPRSLVVMKRSLPVVAVGPSSASASKVQRHIA